MGVRSLRHRSARERPLTRVANRRGFPMIRPARLSIVGREDVRRT